MNEKIQYWSDLAEYDLETARVMLKGKRFLYVGFMCHQAIEKILKGYYVQEKHVTAPYTHNLASLAESSGLHVVMSDGQKDFLNILEPLNIEARYPTYKEEMFRSMDTARCLDILNKTEELLSWIKSRLLKK